MTKIGDSVGAKMDEDGVLSALTVLQSLAPTDLLNKRMLAEMFMVDERTIQRMVARYDLPPAAFGNSVNKRWLVGHVVVWLTDRFQAIYAEAKTRADRIRPISG